MSKRIGQVSAIVAVAATAAVVVTGATLRGETREAPTVTEACATVQWPMIPAECLDGAADRPVRFIAVDAGPEGRATIVGDEVMQERFAIAFQ